MPTASYSGSLNPTPLITTSYAQQHEHVQHLRQQYYSDPNSYGRGLVLPTGASLSPQSHHHRIIHRPQLSVTQSGQLGSAALRAAEEERALNAAARYLATAVSGASSLAPVSQNGEGPLSLPLSSSPQLPSSHSVRDRQMSLIHRCDEVLERAGRLGMGVDGDGGHRPQFGGVSPRLTQYFDPTAKEKAPLSSPIGSSTTSAPMTVAVGGISPQEDRPPHMYHRVAVRSPAARGVGRASSLARIASPTQSSRARSNHENGALGDAVSPRQRSPRRMAAAGGATTGTDVAVAVPDRSPQVSPSSTARWRGSRRDDGAERRHTAVQNAQLRSQLKQVAKEMDAAMAQWQRIVGPFARVAEAAASDTNAAAAAPPAAAPSPRNVGQNTPLWNVESFSPVRAGPLLPSDDATSHHSPSAATMANAASAQRSLFTSPPPAQMAANANAKLGAPNTNVIHTVATAPPHSAASPTAATKSVVALSPPRVSGLLLARQVVDRLKEEREGIEQSIRAVQSNTRRMAGDAEKIRRDRDARQAELDEWVRQQRLLEKALSAASSSSDLNVSAQSTASNAYRIDINNVSNISVESHHLQRPNHGESNRQEHNEYVSYFTRSNPPPALTIPEQQAEQRQERRDRELLATALLNWASADSGRGGRDRGDSSSSSTSRSFAPEVTYWRRQRRDIRAMERLVAQKRQALADRRQEAANVGTAVAETAARIQQLLHIKGALAGEVAVQEEQQQRLAAEFKRLAFALSARKQQLGISSVSQLMTAAPFAGGGGASLRAYTYDGKSADHSRATTGGGLATANVSAISFHNPTPLKKPLSEQQQADAITAAVADGRSNTKANVAPNNGAVVGRGPVHATGTHASIKSSTPVIDYSVLSQLTPSRNASKAHSEATSPLTWQVAAGAARGVGPARQQAPRGDDVSVRTLFPTNAEHDTLPPATCTAEDAIDGHSDNAATSAPSSKADAAAATHSMANVSTEALQAQLYSHMAHLDRIRTELLNRSL